MTWRFPETCASVFACGVYFMATITTIAPSLPNYTAIAPAAPSGDATDSASALSPDAQAPAATPPVATPDQSNNSTSYAAYDALANASASTIRGASLSIQA
jgi:hypothetical protein